MINRIINCNLNCRKINNNVFKHGLFTMSIPKSDCSFKGKIIENNGLDEFNNFEKQAKNTFDEDFNVIANRICNTPELLIGQGASKVVYEIPNIENFVLYKVRRKYNENSSAPFEPTKNLFGRGKYYFGEYIASNNNGLYLGLKIDGKPYSQPDWFKKYCKALEMPDSITENDAKFFLTQLEEIEKFPLESYEDFANQLKDLNTNRTRIDTINPNNILINKETKAFNIIDLIEGQNYFEHFENPINGSSDMIALLLDSLLHAKYMNALSDEDKEKLKNSSKNVVKKCKMASENVGLPSQSEHTMEATKILENRIKKPLNIEPKFEESYKIFVEIYKDVL